MSALPEPIRLDGPCGTLVAFAHGGQAVGWTPAGQDTSVLWLSPTVILDDAKAIRGGVPVCFPWFGPGRSGDMKPDHGFARLTTWQVSEAGVDGEGAYLSMHLDSSIVTSENFPYAYSADISMRAAEDLRIDLTVRNSDSSPFTIEEALHAYLAVGDVRTIVIDGLTGADYVDKALGGARCTQSGHLRIEGRTDRSYRSTNSIEVHDPILKRTLVIAKRGSASTIVWNPGPELAETMSDIGPDAWSGFVCVEAGNVLDDAITVQSGEEHTITYLLSVQA